MVPDLLRAGLRAEGLSPTLQGLWLGEAVTSGLVDDTATLLCTTDLAVKILNIARVSRMTLSAAVPTS